MQRRPRRPHGRALACLLGLLLLASCAGEGDQSPQGRERQTPPAETALAPEDSRLGAQDADARPLVLFLGDSLTAGYGLAEEEAFPARVGERLAEEGLPVRVVNAGVSGDTTAGGLARLDWLLRQEPDVLVVGLGGNDGLRGLSPEMSEENLRQIVTRARGAGVGVLLLGIQLPPNYGADYTAAFRQIYPSLAEELGVPLVPFLLEGVGGEPELSLPDGLHPNAEGQRIVADNVVPYLRELVQERQAAPEGS